jgi:phospholipid transport system substrate-binding protein
MLLAVRADAAGPGGPAEMLSAMTERVLLEIRNDPEMLNDEPRTRSLAEKLILPNIDFRAASQWVLGKHWRTASPAQRESFTAEFRALLVNTYLRSLKRYRDNTVRILAARPGQPNGRAVVDAEVEQADGPLIKVIFRLHQPRQTWLVYDIVIEGISLVATRRTEFSSEIRNKGLDSLIAQLALLNAGEATAAVETPQ